MSDPNDETFLLSRRTMMIGTASVGVASTMPVSTLAAVPDLGMPASGNIPREGVLPTDAASRIAMFRRIRMRTDNGMVYWFYRGRNYAQQGANLIPICELSFGAFMQVNQRQDGGLDVTSFELGFRTNLNSGTRTDQIYNPITDQMIDAPFAPVGPLHISYDAQNNPVLPEDIGGTTITIEHLPEVFYQLGDQVAAQTHTRGRVQTPGKPDRVLNDMSILTAPLAEVLDPKVVSANSRGYGGDVTDYARWLQMPEGSGTQTLRSMGQKYHLYEQMPQDWRDMLASEAPEIAADPIGSLQNETIEYRN